MTFRSGPLALWRVESKMRRVQLCMLRTGTDGDVLLTLCLLKRNSSDTWRAGHVTTVKAGVSVWVVVKSVIPASDKNKYHKYFLGSKGGRSVRLTIFLCRLSLNLGTSTSFNLQDLYRPVQGLILSLPLTLAFSEVPYFVLRRFRVVNFIHTAFQMRKSSAMWRHIYCLMPTFRRSFLVPSSRYVESY